MTNPIAAGDALLMTRDAARAFAADHLPILAAELIERDRKAVLRSGKFRELAELCRPFAGAHDLKVAEAFVHEAALELAARGVRLAE